MSRRILIALFLLIPSLFIGCKKEVEADPKKPAEIQLGRQSTGNGVKLVTSGDGRSSSANVGGSDCRTVKSGKGAHAYFYFAIDPKTKADLKNGKVTVEYFDSAAGELRMQYDGSTIQDDGKGAYSGSGAVVKLLGDQTWKTAVFPFRGAVFKNRQNGRSDFRIESLRADLSIRKVMLTRE